MPAKDTPGSGEIILNEQPFFFGQLPFYAGSAYSFSAPSSFTGLIGNVKIFTEALGDQRIEALTSTQPPLAVEVPSEANTLGVLNQLRRGLRGFVSNNSEFDYVSRALTSPQLLKSLLSIIASGSPLLQGACLRICSLVVPRMEVDIVNEMTASVFGSPESFVERLFKGVGQGVSGTDQSTGGFKANSEAEYGVSLNKLQLLQTLATSKFSNGIWATTVASAFLQQSERIPEALAILSSAPNPDPVLLNSLLGFLAFFGGVMPGVYPGSRVVYADPKGIREECVVISPSAVPVFDPKDKDAAKLWEGLKSHGDAVTVVLLSQLDVPIVVPRRSISVPNALNKDLSELSEFFIAQIGAQRMIEPFQALASLEDADLRPLPIPNKEESFVSLVFESSHPYADSLDEVKEINMPGAQQIEITFDSRSRCEQVTRVDKKRQQQV